jgi:hypothetical protein
MASCFVDSQPETFLREAVGLPRQIEKKCPVRSVHHSQEDSDYR